MAEEQVLLDKKDIKVTSARFVVKGKTFPISTINSVSRMVTTPDWTGPIVVGIIGISAFWLAKQWWYALVLLVLAAGWWFVLRKSYTIEIVQSSGVQKVFTSHNKALVDKIIKALNDAIIGGTP